MPYLHHQRDGSLLLAVHVQPRAASTGLAGLHGGALKIRLNCPPVDGRANQTLIDFLAGLLGLPKSALQIIRGETSRVKTVRIESADEATLRHVLGG